MVRLAPKAELHLHFQGAICPATLLGLARRRGVALPVDDLPALREWFRFRDFAHFVEVYALLRACLVEHHIPLEVCPTSNIALGVYPSLFDHPLPRLVEAGALVTINTDTPAIFGITLSGEAELLRTSFGLSDIEAQRVLQNAVDASFSSAK